LLVELVAVVQDVLVLACMALRRTDVANPAVAMVMVVPMHELARPVACSAYAGEARARELGAVLGRAEQAFDEGVVVTDARA
jgi:hypothetical protein